MDSGEASSPQDPSQPLGIGIPARPLALSIPVLGQGPTLSLICH